MDAPLSLEEQILAATRRIVRAIELHSKDLLHHVGLTTPQIAVLRVIREYEAATPTLVARTLHLSQPTVSGILDRLQQRGLVEPGEVPDDRRKRIYRLTRMGAEAVVKAPSLLQERFRVGLAQLPDWERLMLLASLQRVAALMDAEDVDAAPMLVPGAAVAPTGTVTVLPVSPQPRRPSRAKPSKEKPR